MNATSPMNSAEPVDGREVAEEVADGVEEGRYDHAMSLRPAQRVWRVGRIRTSLIDTFGGCETA